jgi:serine-type D-Ala-D-Ala carboxypeptidase/endopeptidase (penicillin-binding protein 4)
VRARAAADPALEAATALTAALTARGIAVAGPAASLPEGQRLAAAQALGRVDSPPVAALLRHMVQESDNHMADTLFRAAGRHGPGRGSFDDAAAALPALLADLELDWSVAAVRDGSGLSRATAVPPTLLALLDYRMTRSTLGPTWQDLMAVAGVSGTLEGRLTGTIAELRLRGKTGSLGDVRALSGSVVGPDGRTLHLAVVSDQLQPVDLDDARRLQDLVVLALTAELHGCALAAPPSPTGAPTPAPPPAGELPPLPAYAC